MFGDKTFIGKIFFFKTTNKCIMNDPGFFGAVTILIAICSYTLLISNMIHKVVKLTNMMYYTCIVNTHVIAILYVVNT